MTDQQPMVVGQFETADNNKPRKLTESPTPPALTPSAMEVLQAEIAQKPEAPKLSPASAENMSKAMKPPTPEEKAKIYLDGLAAVEVTQSEARIVLESLLTDEYYEETVEIGRGVKAVLRTRTYIDTQRMLRILEAEAPQIPMHYNDILARCNLAASLVAYNQKRFEPPVRTPGMTREAFNKREEEAFHERLDYVMRLPTPVVSKLMDLVAKFDNKIFAVFADGAPSDF